MVLPCAPFKYSISFAFTLLLRLLGGREGRKGTRENEIEREAQLCLALDLLSDCSQRQNIFVLGFREREDNGYRKRAC